MPPQTRPSSTSRVARARHDDCVGVAREDSEVADEELGRSDAGGERGGVEGDFVLFRLSKTEGVSQCPARPQRTGICKAKLVRMGREGKRRDRKTYEARRYDLLCHSFVVLTASQLRTMSRRPHLPPDDLHSLLPTFSSHRDWLSRRYRVLCGFVSWRSGCPSVERRRTCRRDDLRRTDDDEEPKEGVVGKLERRVRRRT